MMTILTFTLPQALFVLVLGSITVASVICYVLMLKKLMLNTKELLDTNANHEERDRTLNYVLRTFNLNVADPYIQRPAYDEKRCYHCHIPQGFQHANDCPWMLVQPVATKLYGKKRL